MAKEINLVETLGDLGCPGEMLELIDWWNMHPDQLGLGDRAALGLALQQLGERLVGSAREQALGRLGPEKEYRYEFVEGKVHFTWRAPTVITRVDTKKVRQAHPPDQEPEYYTQSEGRETVALSYAGG